MTWFQFWFWSWVVVAVLLTVGYLLISSYSNDDWIRDLEKADRVRRRLDEVLIDEQSEGRFDQQ